MLLFLFFLSRMILLFPHSYLITCMHNHRIFCFPLITYNTASCNKIHICYQSWYHLPFLPILYNNSHDILPYYYSVLCSFIYLLLLLSIYFYLSSFLFYLHALYFGSPRLFYYCLLHISLVQIVLQIGSIL